VIQQEQENKPQILAGGFGYGTSGLGPAIPSNVHNNPGPSGFQFLKPEVRRQQPQTHHPFGEYGLAAAEVIAQKRQNNRTFTALLARKLALNKLMKSVRFF
jgi:hypothetical protein